MAKQTVVRLIDDVDQTPAEETIRFGIDRNSYEIDLSQANAELLRKQLEPWIAGARRASTNRSPRR